MQLAVEGSGSALLALNALKNQRRQRQKRLTPLGECLRLLLVINGYPTDGTEEGVGVGGKTTNFVCSWLIADNSHENDTHQMTCEKLSNLKT